MSYGLALHLSAPDKYSGDSTFDNPLNTYISSATKIAKKYNISYKITPNSTCSFSELCGKDDQHAFQELIDIQMEEAKKKAEQET